MQKLNKQLRKDGLNDKRTNQLFQIVDNAIISNNDKYLLKNEIEEGLILNKATLKQKIKEMPNKFENPIENNKEKSYKKSKFNSNNYNKRDTYNRHEKYKHPKKNKQYKKLKPINPDKNYREGLNRQGSIFGVMMIDLVAREDTEEKIYDKLNESLAKNTPNKTWYLLKDALKKYPDNPIFLYYKALALYRNKNFSYADDCISNAKLYAIRYGLSDNFLYKCDKLLMDEEIRREVSTKKRYKRPSRRIYKNNKT